MVTGQDNNNRKDEVDRGNSIQSQSYTKNYTQLRNAENGRNHLPQGREHQVPILYQMTSLENIHRSNIIQSEKVVFRNIQV